MTTARRGETAPVSVDAGIIGDVSQPTIEYASNTSTASVGPLAIVSVVCASVSFVVQGALLLFHFYFFDALWTSILIMAVAPVIGFVSGAVSVMSHGRPRWLAMLGYFGSLAAGIIFVCEFVYVTSSPNFMKGWIGC
jgi:hypothetical protein